MQLLDIDFTRVPIWIVIIAVTVFIILLTVALITGREISFWQIKIGGKNDNSKNESTNKILSSIDEEKIKSEFTNAIISFFKSYDGYSSPAQIIGEAKGIVNRFATELQNTNYNVQNEVQYKKEHDNNWIYANMLRDGLLLVNYIRLTYQTHEKNNLFLKMTLPQIQIPKN
jgi:hypothetical protein